MLSSGEPTERQLVAVALLYGGPAALLNGLLACRWHGVRRGPAPPPGRVHLLIPHNRQLRSTDFVVVERARRLLTPVGRNGARLAPVARACVDAARRLRSAVDVTELLADAIQRGLCDVAELVAELAASGRRGSAVPRAVLAEVSAGVRSAAEREAKRLWPHTGLPEPWWNAPVYDRSGTLLGVADAWCDDVALAWEIESYAFHLSPASYARTVARSARLTAGVVVVPTLPTRLRCDRAGVPATRRRPRALAPHCVPSARRDRSRQGGFTCVQRR